MTQTSETMCVALVSEHASPLACSGDLGTADAGGQNVYVDALARQLALLGASVDVYTRRSDSDTPVVVDLAPGVRIHHIAAGPPADVPKDELFDVMPEFAARLADAWRWRPPDIVHAHFWMSGWASARARQRRRIPFVQTFHALGVVKRRHQGADDTSPRQRDGVERQLLRDADAVIATCRDEVDELIALGGRPERMAVVPCGVDGRFRRGRPHGGPLRITCLGRMVPRKGMGDVIAALPAVSGEAHLVIAGGPPAEDLDADTEIQRLRDLAEQFGVADRCRFVGRLGRQETADLLRASDIVACTPWYEPFGIVPIEAMACGVPVVGTAVGGLLDTVEHGVTGLLVPPRRPDRIAVALDELVPDPQRRRAMGLAGAARVERRYRWPRVARDVFAVYQQVVAEGSSARSAAL